MCGDNLYICTQHAVEHFWIPTKKLYTFKIHDLPLSNNSTIYGMCTQFTDEHCNRLNIDIIYDQEFSRTPYIVLEKEPTFTCVSKANLSDKIIYSLC